MAREIEVWRISPPHENPDPDRVAGMAADMKAHGWRGRPLLVERLDDGGTAFQAWTGSHRLAAALLALGMVPIHEVDLDRFVPHLAGELADGETVFSRTSSDEQRLGALVEVEDLEAAQLMRAELRAGGK